MSDSEKEYYDQKIKDENPWNPTPNEVTNTVYMQPFQGDKDADIQAGIKEIDEACRARKQAIDQAIEEKEDHDADAEWHKSLAEIVNPKIPPAILADTTSAASDGLPSSPDVGLKMFDSVSEDDPPRWSDICENLTKDISVCDPGCYQKTQDQHRLCRTLLEHVNVVLYKPAIEELSARIAKQGRYPNWRDAADLIYSKYR